MRGFQPNGNTVVCVGSTASGSIQYSTVGAGGDLRLQNMSTDRAFCTISTTGIAATVPSSSGSGTGFPLEAGASVLAAGPPSGYLTAITTVASAAVRIAVTPGSGDVY